MDEETIEKEITFSNNSELIRFGVAFLAVSQNINSFEPKSLRFAGYSITSIDITEMPDGTVTKIQLWCKEGPLASALTKPAHRNNLVIKDYSENEGLMDVLTDGKIVEIDDLGFCKLLV